MITHVLHTLQSLKIGLKVVDGSLKINAPKGALTPEIVDQIKAHKNELIALLSSSESIPKAVKKECYALTSSQQRLWTLSQFGDGNTTYNIFNAFEFNGKIDIDALSIAYTKVIERHESLRTIFKEDKDGVLGQYIIPEDTYPSDLLYIDLSTSDTTVSKQYIEDFKEHIFDLQSGPLFIGAVVKLSQDQHVLMFNMHHIIGDGWSMEVLNKEFMTLYNGLYLGQEVTLAALPIQYKDYSEWQHTEARQDLLQKSKAFWLDTFSGELPVLDLPSSNVRPKIKTYQGSGLDDSFSKKFTSQLNGYAQQKGVTLFMVLMAGINGLLSRYANTRDLILGTPVAGRAHSDLESQIGLYLNTLAIRTKFEETSTFEELLAIQKKTLLNAYSHQDYPFDSLIEDLTIKSDVSRSALFDVLVVFQNQKTILSSNAIHLEGVDIVSYESTKKSFSKFDLSFAFLEVEDQLFFHIEYNTDIYELDFIERLGVHFENFLSKAIQAPQDKVATINYLTSDEESQLLVDFNETTVAYPDTTMVDLFVNQAKKTPDATALLCGDMRFTYKELDVLSNQLSHYLLSTYSLEQENLVGVKLDRSEWLLISLLAVLKAGCAYVPLDTKYPAQRIAYIEQDSQCKVTIDDEVINSFKAAKPVSKKLPKVAIASEDLAYIIYTSGSTGKPKGVMITHKNASSMLHWSASEFSDTHFEVLYAVTSHCFDLSVYEFFYPLSIGKPIRLLDSGLSISDYVETDSHILINTVPSVAKMLIDKEVNFSNVVGINLAGEPFPSSITTYFKDSGIALRNLYGPSEDTTYSSIYRVEKEYDRSVPIGKGIHNTQFYILSDALALQPLGVIGEICISGDGISKGYLHQPELTKEKFIVNRFRESGTLYKTGDLGKWLPNGTIEYVGRKDSQVKIRGHRIELGEIEHVLHMQKIIDQAVVVTSTIQGEPMIVCYLVCSDVIDKKQLRLSLSQALPDYMLPSYYVFLDEMPLTPNGKIDKQSLPDALTVGVSSKVPYVAPCTCIEEKLVAIWEEVLGVKKIGILDDFFELGGHSIKGTKVLSKINKEFNVVINIKNLFMSPTIEYLASQILFTEKQEVIKSEKVLLVEIEL